MCCEHTMAEDQAMVDIVAVKPISDYDAVVIDTLQGRPPYALGIVERGKLSMAQYETMGNRSARLCEQDDLLLIVNTEGVSSAATPGPRMRGVDGHIGAVMQQEAVNMEVAWANELIGQLDIFGAKLVPAPAIRESNVVTM